MNNCTDFYFLSTIACKLSECLTDDELELLAVNLTALADLLQIAVTKNSICKKDE